ncbi:MAG: prenyltransferase/squalene oxidase repeat-containing protein [Planctomycetota bacterium]|jgi:hypothetical protein
MTPIAMLRNQAGRILLLASLLVLPFAGSGPVISQELPDEVERPMDAELVDQARLAIHRGLQYLKASQNANGSWTDKIGRKVHYNYDAIEGQHVGVTALACTAFIAGGSLPGVGEYGEQVERGLQYVVRNVGENGFITANGSRMYSHAFATLFLAEVYGMTGMSEVRAALKRSVGLIVQAQNEQGGWRYQPGANDADMSITVCQVMALRAANNSGIHVPKGTIDNAIRYVRNSYDPTYDGFSYQADDGRSRGRSRTTFSLTAAGVTALYGAGVYDDPMITDGLVYLLENRPSRYEAESTFDYYYGMYYATQAAFQRGGEYWYRWHRSVWRDVIALQDRGQGSWRDLVGPNYATAMACIIMQIPYQYLPIFER